MSASFVREYGCTLSEWQRWMDGGATQGRPRESGPGMALLLSLPTGTLQLRWRELEPRVIALIRLPRLEVRFEFVGVPPDEQAAFLTVFDRHLQRGGG